MSAALIGRELELRKLKAALMAGKNVLLEGPVGVGKTQLALHVTQGLGRPVYRIDGDSRYTEQKLSGSFDPPSVLQKGYVAESFIPGPLVEAMQRGGVLFINEMNRLPEGVQNVLLPAIDERLVVVPRLGTIQAAPGFCVIATQNPKEFVATSHLSEAILDRFELVTMEYQSEDEEKAIVRGKLPATLGDRDRLVRVSVRVARLTRSHPRIRRGASVRAAISIAELSAAFIAQGLAAAEAIQSAVGMALPTRIEVEREADSERSHQAEVMSILEQIVQQALAEGDAATKKT